MVPSESGEQAGRIGPTARVLMGLAGVVSWSAGGVTAFVNTNGAGTVALVATGAVAGILALVGRWPSRIGVSGHEIAWDNVRQTVRSQIESAKAGGEPDEALTQLRVLQQRLDGLRVTGTVPAHPAARYDERIRAAVCLLRPDLRVEQGPYRTDEIPDFTLRLGDRVAHLETKWRADPDTPVRASSVDTLLERTRDVPLLVVANTPHIEQVTERVRQAVPDRAVVVTWRDRHDDDMLRAALDQVLPR